MRYYVQIEGDRYPLAAYRTVQAAIERAMVCCQYGSRPVKVNDDAGKVHWTSQAQAAR